MILTTGLRLPDELVEPLKNLTALGLKVQEQVLATYWSPEGLEAVASSPGKAWKLLDTQLSRPQDVYIPSRAWRCILESAGRVLRSMAERKRIFELLLPYFNGKAKDAAKELYGLLKKDGKGEKFGYLFNVAEAVANFYAEHERLPKNFFELQKKPEPKKFTFTTSPDDGPEKGQVVRYECDGRVLRGRVKLPTCPEPRKEEDWRWFSFEAELPEELQEKLARGGKLCAPDLRLKVKPSGKLVALLDVKVEVPEKTPSGEKDRALGVDWGLRKLVTGTVVSKKGQLTPPFFVFWQALKAKLLRIREGISRLQKTRDRYERKSLEWKEYNRMIASAWQKYHRIQHQLAHQVSSLLVLLARAFGCRYVFVEWLLTLRGEKGRSKDLNWWVTTTVRGLLFRLLRYKARLLGIRVVPVPPGGTSTVCPRCLKRGKHVKSPSEPEEKDSGSWFVCPSCGYNADRDYVGSLNVGRTGFKLERPLTYTVCQAAAEPFPSQGAPRAMTFTTLGYIKSVFVANFNALTKLLEPAVLPSIT
ncbi:transposase IS605 OrfB [Ammonifex degensii KC4]|uniref:Transposase IS605 OrfB n=1 Tax=Ammonifex degensii (strain DSM 10501 / KC4) TaxID=429009 RepID=C9RCI4_AMMDK|nr:zinc ribbon domain-containing protein [Ammonifex degensii]ACX51961.1 transposase IS605 OrfB [Ammonifex degensii KC4]